MHCIVCAHTERKRWGVGEDGGDSPTKSYSLIAVYFVSMASWFQSLLNAQQSTSQTASIQILLRIVYGIVYTCARSPPYSFSLLSLCTRQMVLLDSLFAVNEPASPSMHYRHIDIPQTFPTSFFFLQLGRRRIVLSGICSFHFAASPLFFFFLFALISKFIIYRNDNNIVNNEIFWSGITILPLAKYHRK